MSNNITTIVAVLIAVNLIYVIYSCIVKKNYYENIFITTSVFIGAFIMRPIKASFAFNAKYGFSILDLIYYAIIGYIILVSVLRNNNFFMINMSWEAFYKVVKEVFRKKGVDTYYRIPVIYIDGSKAKIELSMNLFAKNVIMVKFTGVSSVVKLKELKKMLNDEFRVDYAKEFKKSKYFYLIFNILMTVLILLIYR
ncbi:hypothetical protein [Proteocatella sphenisci]|uniref:hypothetical protein n=1 Tax=Proteocatella sphenisci TaxID=181070 RepID=UPI00048C955C|nr:hypothetical protein [Proteocatella sphenisci]